MRRDAREERMKLHHEKVISANIRVVVSRRTRLERHVGEKICMQCFILKTWREKITCEVLV
jgi:hypothetical protein